MEGLATQGKKALGVVIGTGIAAAVTVLVIYLVNMGMSGYQSYQVLQGTNLP